MQEKKTFYALIATGFGSGYSPFAPGTMGALLAVIIWLVLFFLLPYKTLFYVTLFLIFLFTFLGVKASNVLEKYWGKDPSRIVVDEMVGVWIPLLAVPNQGNFYLYVLAAFILFRLLDIFKPFGIRKMEEFEGGWGVMLDDILAGLYSWLIIAIFKWVNI